MHSDIRIMITADLHLGMQASDAGIPGSARMDTFKRILELAEDHDLLLIAGDLIDAPSIDDGIIDLLQTGFQRLKDHGVAIVYTAGAGELTQSGDLPGFFDAIPLDHCFAGRDDVLPFELLVKDQKLYIYGAPGHADFPIHRIRRIANDGFHIGLFHVDFNTAGNDAIAVLKRDTLKSLGFDFYALGSNHHFRLFKFMDRIIGAYPGSPESVGRDELGDRFVVSLVLQNNQVTQIRRLVTNTMTVKETLLDCTDQPGIRPLRASLEEAASPTVIHRVTLRGERRFALAPSFIDGLRPSYFLLELIDESEPTIDAIFEEFADDRSLRGEFYRLLKERLDLGMVPADLDRRDLTATLNRLSRRNFTTLEEWLCGW